MSRQGQKASTHPTRFVRIHVGVGQRRRAIDGDSRALQAKRRCAYNISLGRWMSAQGRFNRRAHVTISPTRFVRIHVGVGQRGRAVEVDVESPAPLPTMGTRDVPAGCWMRAQRRSNRRTHPSSLILVHVGAGQRCRAIPDVESPAPLPTMRTRDVPAGRWTRAQGGFNRRANPISLVLVHVGVGQRCRAPDVESPAILPTMSTRNVPAGRRARAQGGFNGREHT